MHIPALSLPSHTYYLSTAMTPDETDMVYVHKLHIRLAYKPKLTLYHRLMTVEPSAVLDMTAVCFFLSCSI